MILLDALKRQNRGRPPLWIMRQAGRYLPSYRSLRERHSLWDLFHNSALAAEVTLLPLKELALDAAIVFSDILVVAELFGLKVHFPEGKAPFVQPLVADVNTLTARPAKEVLHYVKETIQLIKPQISVPLIGFCGGPFTVASYLIEQGHKETLSKTKQWLFTDPEGFHTLLQKITAASIDYLKMQVEAGVQVIQIFDSWAHVLAPAQFEAFSLAYLKEITRQIRTVPIILFCRGSCYRVNELASASPAAISFDWQRDLKTIAQELPSSIAIQGNLDPDLLRGDPHILKENARALLDSMRGHPGYIFNLGHGILPDTPVDNVKTLIELVIGGNRENWDNHL